MSITPRPEQTLVIDKAIQAGFIRSGDEALEIAVDTLRARLRTAQGVGTKDSSNPDEWILRFRAWAREHRSTAPPLSAEAISRESIYADRG